MKQIQPKSLFVASCLALLVTSLSFGIRAGILGQLGVQFHLSGQELAVITGTAFWGFPLAVIAGGFIVDAIGMKRLLVGAFFLHLIGIILTVCTPYFSSGFWPLFISTLFIGMANGTVEAACNPLVATIYPDNKTTKLNHFHLWFPGGIVVGTLLVFFFNKINLGWQVQVATMILPTLIYGYLFLRLDFPVTERVAAGVSNKQMYRSIASPLFIFMLICMLGTAITELFTNQWIEILLKNVTSYGILILALTAGVQVLGRAVAGPIVHRISPAGVLLGSAILSALGLYLMGTVSGNMLILAAIIFGMGITYFWPTMLGFVSETIPESGALGMNLIGGAGMLAVTGYTIFMGGFYDNIIAKNLPAGASMDAYRSAAAGTPEAGVFAQAQAVAGPEILHVTLVIPIILIVVFAGLFIYMRGAKKNLQTA